MHIKFSVPGQPQGKGRAKASNRGGFIKMRTPEKTIAYEGWVKQCAVEQLPLDFIPTKQAISAVVTMFYQMPKSGTKAVCVGRENGSIRPMTKPDIDNVLKAIFDSLNGIVYHDDSQIVEVTSSKHYSDKPRVEVLLKTWEREE